jgi:hypothetical protein
LGVFTIDGARILQVFNHFKILDIACSAMDTCGANEAYILAIISGIEVISAL